MTSLPLGTPLGRKVGFTGVERVTEEVESAVWLRELAVAGPLRVAVGSRDNGKDATEDLPHPHGGAETGWTERGFVLGV